MGEAGLRVTQQRIVIYKALFGSKMHPTAELIYKGLKDDHPSLSLATVYKTLDSFVEVGLINKLNGADDSYHYDADLHSHNHLICTKTKSIIDYDDPQLVQLISDYIKKKKPGNFEIHQVQINILGETLN